jgi:hypothetical protein
MSAPITQADVIVVGSGGAGLVAACAAADRGLRVLVLEATSQLGGTTALSGGQLWIPANPVMARAGLKDSIVDARQYLERNVLGSTSHERLESFLANGPALVNYIEELGVPLLAVNRPDYHPGWEGAHAGRTLEPLPVRSDSLGDWKGSVRGSRSRPPATSVEGRQGLDAEVLAHRQTNDVRTQGAGLVAGLVSAALQRNVRLKTETRVVDLRRTGDLWALLSADDLALKAPFVVLAAGGFARNERMRADFLPLVEILPTAAPGSNGDGLYIGIRAGGSLHGMSEAWWTPAASIPRETIDEVPSYRNVVRELAFPGSILINEGGRRFANEASSYNDLGKAFLAFDPANHCFPNAVAWLIFDASFRATRTVLGVRPTDPDPAWFDRAPSLEELALAIGIDSRSLAETIDTFNKDATAGHDTLFGRGDNAHDRFNGDTNASNATLGPILEGPFYAVSIRLGANGTKGGLLVDELGRVLQADSTPVAGLFAAGENAAALMGPGYAGSGASLGPALTAAYVLARNLPAVTNHAALHGSPQQSLTA